jgi:hypothetical protein
MGDHLQPQPPPVANDKPAVWDLVVQDLERDVAHHLPNWATKPWDVPEVVALVLTDARARDAQGRERYGVPLQAGNGRDALVDAYQEALDLAVYLRQAIEEMVTASTPPQQQYIVLLYQNALRTVRHLRWVLIARDGR